MHISVPVDVHLLHGRKSLHFDLRDLQGKHAAAALLRKAIRRALCRISLALLVLDGSIHTSFVCFNPSPSHRLIIVIWSLI